MDMGKLNNNRRPGHKNNNILWFIEICCISIGCQAVYIYIYIYIYISLDLIDEDDLLALFLYPIIGLL